MHMMVCSEWAGATLPSRVAPQKFCIIMLLSRIMPGREHFCFSLSGAGQGHRKGRPEYNDSHILKTREKENRKWKTIASI